MCHIKAALKRCFLHVLEMLSRSFQFCGIIISKLNLHQINMQTKTKTILAVLAVFILTGAVALYYYKIKMSPVVSESMRNDSPSQAAQQDTPKEVQPEK